MFTRATRAKALAARNTEISFEFYFVSKDKTVEGRERGGEGGVGVCIGPSCREERNTIMPRREEILRSRRRKFIDDETWSLVYFLLVFSPIFCTTRRGRELTYEAHSQKKEIDD